MNTLKHLTSAALCLYGLTAVTGCAEQDVSMTIELAASVDPNTCSPNASAPQTRGTVDISMAQSYVVYPGVFNNMPDVRSVKQFNETNGRTNTSIINLTKAEVRYLPQERVSVNLPQSLEIPYSGSIGTGTNAVFGVEVFTNDILQSLRNADEFLGVGAQGEAVPLRNSVEMLVGIKVFGKTLAGQDVESNEFLFPITICNGCLVSVPNSAVDPNQPTPNCLRFDPLFDEVSVSCPTLVGQDFAVDCRVCKSQPATPLSAQLCEPSAF